MKRIPQNILPPPPIAAVRNSGHRIIKAAGFQVVHFDDPKSPRVDGSVGGEVILIYALGEDGVIREFSGGAWKAFPIEE